MNKVSVVEVYEAKKRNAEKRNLSFDMSLVAFENIVNQTKCAYSGAQFNDSDVLFSFERIDNKIGYVDGNVIPVRRDWNTIRNQHDSKSLADAIETISNKMINIKKQIGFLSERLKQNQALNDAPTELVEKIRINKNHYNTWLKLYNDMIKKSKSVENLCHELDRLKTLSVRKSTNTIKTKREKMQGRILNNLKNRKASKKNAVKKYENFLTQVKFERTVGKIPVEAANKSKLCVMISEDKNYIKKLSNDLKKYENMLDIYSKLYVQLCKFENLNMFEKSKVKHGLPLDYPTFKLIKNKAKLKMVELWYTACLFCC